MTRGRGSTAVTVRYFEVDGRAVESFSVDAAEHRLALLEDGVLIALAESGAMFRLSAQQPMLDPIGSIDLAGETIEHVAAMHAVPRLVIVTDETIRVFTADGEPVAEFSPPVVGTSPTHP